MQMREGMEEEENVGGWQTYNYLSVFSTPSKQKLVTQAVADRGSQALGRTSGAGSKAKPPLQGRAHLLGWRAQLPRTERSGYELNGKAKQVGPHLRSAPCLQQGRSPERPQGGTWWVFKFYPSL